jgi:hypothetical protein
MNTEYSEEKSNYQGKGSAKAKFQRFRNQNRFPSKVVKDKYT